MRDELKAAGVKRINVSLDTLDAREIRRDHALGPARPGDGRHSAPPSAPGLQVKINAVALKGVNDDEFDRLIAWCGEEGFDLTLIEVMPMGEIGAGDAASINICRCRWCAADLQQALDARRERLPHRRAGALLHRARDRPAARLHHADDA